MKFCPSYTIKVNKSASIFCLFNYFLIYKICKCILKKLSKYLLLIECEVRNVHVSSILMAKARSARTTRKKQWPITSGTTQANEVNTMFIIWLSFFFCEVELTSYFYYLFFLLVDLFERGVKISTLFSNMSCRLSFSSAYHNERLSVTFHTFQFDFWLTSLT